MIFPAAAALAWAVLAYVCIDFGFWQKIFPARRRQRIASGAPAPRRRSRRRCWSSCSPISTSAAGMCAAAHVDGIWLIFLRGPGRPRGLRRAGRRGRRADLARHRSPASASSSSSTCPTHGFDRAVMLIPTWLLLLVWVTAAGFTVTGHADQRSRLAGADRRARADRHADRLHGHAERLCERRARVRARSRTSSARRWR